jgi:hypothetical protein
MVLNSLMLAGGDFKSFVMAMACYRIGQQDKGRLNLLVLKQLRQVGYICRNPPRLIARINQTPQ